MKSNYLIFHRSTLKWNCAKENGGRHLVIEVEDTVSGISAEDQNRLFEPFVRLGEAGVQKGTGLGLAISRRFIELMGGTIGVVSAPAREPAVPSNADVQRTGFGVLAGKSPMSADVYERRSSCEMRRLSRMSAAVKGFGCRPMPKLATASTGRRPKVSGEGTRGKQGTRDCTTL